MNQPLPYPVFLHLADAQVLIVGGGNVAVRKTRSLLAAGAHVTVVSTTFHDDFLFLPTVERINTPYSVTHMARHMWHLAFAATNDRIVNALVHKNAATLGILCCRCDDPDLGDFSGAATWTSENSHVTLAVGTTGASPILAARIRDAAAASVDPLLLQWAQLFAAWRPRVKEELDDPSSRHALLAALAGPTMESTLAKSGPAAAEKLFEKWLTAARAGKLPPNPAGPASVNHAE